ncbi:MAG: hypothetical protein HZA22_11310 [Nitrospirae bacterium]|nr:hypothetical protein [Nitrospirota bacterium]
MKGLSRSVSRAALSAAAALVILSATVSHAHQLPEGFSGFEDPSVCGKCHEEIYNEWSSSMHAKSSRQGDPVHAAVHGAYTSAIKAQGGKADYHCANCHAPAAANLEALTKGDAAPDDADPSAAGGVTCSFCHKVDGLVEGEEFHTYRVTDTIKGSADNPDAAHEVELSEFASSYKMCLGCHGKKVNSKGGVTCSMEEEGISDCLTCHMPQVGDASGKPSHAFHGMHGGHNPEMLKRGAAVSLGAEVGRLVVSLKNTNPHFFPSTNPMRVAYVKVEVFGADGALLFTNFDKDPSADPKAMMMRVFKAGDKLGVASWDADGVARDTRLAAGEDRLITYELPAGAARATAKLFYRLVPGPAIEKFRIPKDGVVDVPHLVSEAEIKL